MIKKLTQPSILIEANIKVNTLEQMGWKNYTGVHYDTRLAFYVNGLYHDSVVFKCDGTIAPGSSGKTTFLMASDALFETDVTMGSHVELRGGSALVATAEILSMKRVFVKTDPSSECGYVILDEKDRELE